METGVVGYTRTVIAEPLRRGADLGVVANVATFEAGTAREGRHVAGSSGCFYTRSEYVVGLWCGMARGRARRTWGDFDGVVCRDSW
jgi:hypothetical protein